MEHTEESAIVRRVLDIMGKEVIPPKDFLKGLIIDGFVALEQMVECEIEVKEVFSMLSNDELQTVSSNIFIINAWIQEIMRKRKDGK